MLSQYARLVREGCVMSGVTTAYQLNYMKSNLAAHDSQTRGSAAEPTHNSSKSAPAVKASDSCRAIEFLQKCAHLCYEESICRKGQLQNSAAMYFWDEYDRLISQQEYLNDIARMTCLLILDNAEVSAHKKALRALMKSAYAPNVIPAFTSIYYKLLESLIGDKFFPPDARFRYKTLLRSFRETDFETTPVCKCCYRRVCTIEILEALPGYIWDVEDALEGDEVEESDEMSFRSAPSDRELSPTTAWFDGWARRETLQEGLNDVYTEFLEFANIDLDAEMNSDIESFCALLNIKKQHTFDTTRSFVLAVHRLFGTFTQSELKYWYTIQEELVQFVLRRPMVINYTLPKSACIIGAEFLRATWKVCELDQKGFEAMAANKLLLTDALLREIYRVSPLLAMWANVVLAKSLLGLRTFEGLEIGAIYIIRCIMPIAVANLKNTAHFQTLLEFIMESYSERLDFRTIPANAPNNFRAECGL